MFPLIYFTGYKWNINTIMSHFHVYSSMINYHAHTKNQGPECCFYYIIQWYRFSYLWASHCLSILHGRKGLLTFLLSPNDVALGHASKANIMLCLRPVIDMPLIMHLSKWNQTLITCFCKWHNLWLISKTVKTVWNVQMGDIINWQTHFII